MKLVNKQPTETTEGLNDLTRVYSWALKGHAAAHRQTVMLSAIASATLNGFIRSQCTLGHRHAVQVSLSNDPGVIRLITHGVRQHFGRFACGALGDLDESRFDFFKSTVFPTKVKPLIDRNVHAVL